jgi:hypothetical protein
MPCPVAGLLEEVYVGHLIKIEGKLKDHVLGCSESRSQSDTPIQSGLAMSVK